MIARIISVISFNSFNSRTGNKRDWRKLQSACAPEQNLRPLISGKVRFRPVLKICGSLEEKKSDPNQLWAGQEQR